MRLAVLMNVHKAIFHGNRKQFSARIFIDVMTYIWMYISLGWLTLS